MTKQQQRAIERAWKQFDRSTAYGCAQRKQSFDLEWCQHCWDAYRAVCASYGDTNEVPSPIGLQ